MGPARNGTSDFSSSRVEERTKAVQLNQPAIQNSISTQWHNAGRVALCAPGALVLTRSMPAGLHPRYQHVDGEQAGCQDEHDDGHPMFALVARKVREQQLARTIHNIFSHNLRVLI
jgi:hypothetical protein